MNFVGRVSGRVASIVVGVSVVSAWVTPVFADETRGGGNALIGALSVGGALANVDERTGQLSTVMLLASLPGFTGIGGVDLSVSYAQNRVGAGDTVGLGEGWEWGVNRVGVDGGVRVFPASGGVYEADADAPSGLARYPQKDLVFRQETGAIDVAVLAGTHTLEYGFVLELLGGDKEYFSSSGFLIARVDRFGNATQWEWDENTGHLLGVSDRAGNRLVLEWTDSTIRIQAPGRSDGVAPEPIVIGVGSRGVTSVETAGENTVIDYDSDDRLSWLRSPAGATTHVDYRDALGGVVTVKDITVSDATGRELSVKRWEPVGENLSTGFPVVAGGESALWRSGDGEYRYRTSVSDGVTYLESEYNSMGLLVGRDMFVTGAAGRVSVQEQGFEYSGSEAGGVPAAHQLPAQYNKPLSTTTTFRDGERSRTVAEHTEWDVYGRMISHRDPQGTVTATIYDNTPVAEGALALGLVTEQTVTGVDGTVMKSVNTLTPDHGSVAATETFTGIGPGDLSLVTRTQFVTEKDGFVAEETITSLTDDDSDVEPESVTTHHARNHDEKTKTVTITQSTAVGTDAQSSTSTTQDLASGLVVGASDATGRATSNRYDATNRLVSVTDPAGNTVTTKYEDHGLVSRVTTPDGVVTSTYRDALGNVVKVTNNITEAGGAPVVSSDPGFERVVETREYADNNSRVTVTDALGRKAVSSSDVFGRPLTTSLKNGLTQVSVYDDVENTVTSGVKTTPEASLAGALQTSTQYRDAVGQQTRVTGSRADGAYVPESTVTRDGLGRVIESTGADVRTMVGLNANGTPRTTTTAPVDAERFPGNVVMAERAHDMTGASVNKTLTASNGESAEGVVKKRDEQGRVTSVTDQMGNVRRHSYSSDGLVAQTVEEASETVTRNTFDPVTRLLTETVTERPGATTMSRCFDYEPLTGRLREVYDPAGREVTHVTYTYDVLGNVTSVTYPDGKTLTSVFDVNGLRTSTTDVAGNTTRFEYNELGLLTSAKQTTATGETLARVVYEHDVLGRVTSLTRDNGVHTSYTFTSANEIATEKTVDGHGETIFKGRYVYDTHGNVTQKTTTQAQADSAGPVTETTVYKYNPYNQLTESHVFAGDSPVGEPALHTQYEIGVAGSITKETVADGDVARVREFEYNALGQTIAIVTDGVRAEQEYDEAGNLLADVDGTRYRYNAYNQAVTRTTPEGDLTHTTYWVTGKRATSVAVPVEGERGGTTLYWDDETLVNETISGASSTTTSAYLLGSSRHARTVGNDPSTTEHYVTDRHGSSVALTDRSGAVVGSYGYSDYGAPTARTTPDERRGRNAFMYAGEYTNPDGSQELGKRTYIPTSFGFTTRDSAPLYNLYAYGDANPITKIDPSGQTSIEDVGANGILAGVGLLFSLAGFGASVYAFGARSLLAFTNAVFGAADVAITTTQLVKDFAPESVGSAWSEELSRGLGIGLMAASAITGGASGARAFGELKAIDKTVDESSELMRRMIRQGIDGQKFEFKVSHKFEFDGRDDFYVLGMTPVPEHRFYTQCLLWTTPQTRFGFIGEVKMPSERDPSLGVLVEEPKYFLRNPAHLEFLRYKKKSFKISGGTTDSGPGQTMTESFFNKHNIDVAITPDGLVLVRPQALQDNNVGFVRVGPSGSQNDDV